MNWFKIKYKVTHLEPQQVLRVEDEHGREYMWDGLALYRLKPLKGPKGKKIK